MTDMCWYRCNACHHVHRGFESHYVCSMPACTCRDRFGGLKDEDLKETT